MNGITYKLKNDKEKDLKKTINEIVSGINKNKNLIKRIDDSALNILEEIWADFLSGKYLSILYSCIRLRILMESRNINERKQFDEDIFNYINDIILADPQLLNFDNKYNVYAYSLSKAYYNLKLIEYYYRNNDFELDLIKLYNHFIKVIAYMVVYMVTIIYFENQE